MVDLDKSKIQAVVQYIDEVSKQFSTGKATEHSYRPALAKLLGDLHPKFTITNEPSRIQCGAPDYIIAKGKGATSIPVAFVEAKDIGDSDLDGNRQHKEQFNRYKNSLDHILFTDYLDFHLYENGEFINSIRIAEIKGNKIALIDDNVPMFLEMVAHIAESTPQKITSSTKLAQMMAAKARLLAEVIEKTLEADSEKTGELAGQWKSFQKVLIHDLTERQFADIYAQTICYGMFAARLHDDTPDTFSREEAATLIPKTNPFLRKVFQNVAAFDVDTSIAWIVDELAETFRVTDMPKVMKNFGKATGQADPMIHFYEDFLRYYDPKQKKACGVYYTPEPVVHFIVNAVDEILKTRFGLSDGLADTSKVTIRQTSNLYTDNRTKDHKKYETREYHKVQILDPATGTGTFLAEVVRKIYSGMENQKGAWQNYVEEHLLPRLNGFEFMMAPYAVAHLKLDMVLAQTGYKARQDKRLRIFLTNSLEECDHDTGTLFAQWLAQEANEANLVKRDTPVMVMIGNPPYSVSSSNKSAWILNLLNDYKKNLNEKKLNLDDDYIKFIRLGHYYVEKNGEGILAYISNNSFIDGITHRQMRKALLETFDEIYILDLHGNTRKKETALDGGKDENVFDIMQGVSINIFIKKKQSVILSEARKGEVEGSLAKVYHYELFGKRFEKYAFLAKTSFSDIPWYELTPQAPQYFFVPKDFSVQEEYEKGFKVDDLMKVRNSGVKTDRDLLFYDCDKDCLIERISSLLSGKQLEKNFIELYNVVDSSSYKITDKIKCCKFDNSKIQKAEYRVLDFYYIYYDEKLVSRAAFNVMQHLRKANVALVVPRQCSSDWKYVFCTNTIGDHNLIASAGKLGAGDLFPLYLYPTEGEEKLGETRKPNLDESIWRKIDACLDECHSGGQGPIESMDPIEASPLQGDNRSHITTPEQVFDYIYGILHTPSYREKYKEFLKIDFPRIPYPENKEEFERIVSIGNKLRKLHLMEEIPPQATSFDIEGDNAVSEIRFEREIPDQVGDDISGKVYINKTQYFGNVPELAWNFYIGGYQPAQKWLKDRKNRTLTYDDISHYRKIIAILIETQNLMQNLDEIAE
ncbi:MAG: N-6 DNA methylase [Fibrobacter sp.]|uniref:type ISP restriction/modification enzyme n=1 Tax=Fibrobacter sp. TaxID=35828 RepID=UPI0025B85F2E|nr:type ISP restriction/modification enzyme [Fibrobacter sp.]MBQ9226065.1 N-6 DNA methylase [Fibrobacter sp.]